MTRIVALPSYFVAQYRASKIRPISLDEQRLYIRYGLFSRDREIPLRLIARAMPMADNDKRLPGELRYRQYGSLNVAIELRPGSRLSNFLGVASPVSRIGLSIDDPVRFLESINRAAGDRPI